MSGLPYRWEKMNKANNSKLTGNAKGLGKSMAREEQNYYKTANEKENLYVY